MAIFTYLYTFMFICVKWHGITHERVISHTWIWHLMSHIWMSHVTHMNESRHKRVISHTRIRHLVVWGRCVWNTSLCEVVVCEIVRGHLERGAVCMCDIHIHVWRDSFIYVTWCIRHLVPCIRHLVPRYCSSGTVAVGTRVPWYCSSGMHTAPRSHCYSTRDPLFPLLQCCTCCSTVQCYSTHQIKYACVIWGGYDE